MVGNSLLYNMGKVQVENRNFDFFDFSHRGDQGKNVKKIQKILFLSFCLGIVKNARFLLIFMVFCFKISKKEKKWIFV